MYELPIQFSSVPAMRMGLHVSRQRYKRHVPDDQHWSRCVSLRQLFQVDTERRGGWRQMLGSEASEPRDLFTDRKIAFLPTPPSFEASAQGEPLRISRWNLPQKTRGMGLLYGENCVILATTIFDWSTRVTDGRTDGIAMAYTRYSYAVTHKNCAKNHTKLQLDLKFCNV